MLERRNALARSCERALVAGARRQRAGTRQQLRAEARRFVRRHRRDAGYLAWVLRSVGTSSALAVALLGLAAAPAGADLAPAFREQTGAANPLDGQDAGTLSRPSLSDLDGDGDLDVIAGTGNGDFAYYENTGSVISAAFTVRTGAENPLEGQSVAGLASPAPGDLDGDGDTDLIAGDGDGHFAWYKNTGSAESPAFVPRTGVANPLDGQDVGASAAVSLGDLDRDGDLDLVAGAGDGTLLYFENTGSATIPAFVPRTGAANPLAGQDLGERSAPALGDVDGDGDLDLVAGERYGGILHFYENTGNATSPAFVLRTGVADPLQGQAVGDDAAPVLGDLDKDGDPDLIAGQSDGAFRSSENLAGGFVVRSGVANPLEGLDVGFAAAPALGDLDADGDVDLVSGVSSGTFSYFENTGSATNPIFAARTGTANPLDGFDVGVLSAPALGDLDGDGDLDLVSGEASGVFYYFENTGNAVSPAFAPRTGTANPLDGQDVGDDSRPALGDLLNFDGDLDLVAGASTGALFTFRNTGAAGSPAFVQLTGTANPLRTFDVGSEAAPALGDLQRTGGVHLFAGALDGSLHYFLNGSEQTGSDNPADGIDVGDVSAPSFGDVDGDGDLDLVVGSSLGTFTYLESFVAQVPRAFGLTGSANPLAGVDVGFFAAPALVDLERDGDADLIAGEMLGGFALFENTGSALTPAFLARTGAENPLAATDVGYRAKPSFGDLDGDGDPDLLAGNNDGDFAWCENTGTATAPAFADPLVNPFGLTRLDFPAAAPTLGDLDGDGDLDLVAGELYDALLYFENTGSRANPAFVPRVSLANPLRNAFTDNAAAPVFGDFNGDGDLDLISGGQKGFFNYHSNVRNATSPSIGTLFATQAGNPLRNEDAGAASTAAAADLDGDGDLDLVSGNGTGVFRVYYFPEPGGGALLGAGAMLLAFLRPARRARGDGANSR